MQSQNKIFLGNLPWSVDTGELTALLRSEGFMFRSATVITERETGRSRGFAFVEFETPEMVEEAIFRFDGYDLHGRILQASIAKEREGVDGRHRGSISRRDEGGRRDRKRSSKAW